MTWWVDPKTGKEFQDPYGNATAKKLIEKGFVPRDNSDLEAAKAAGYTGRTAKDIAKEKITGETINAYKSFVPEYQSYLTKDQTQLPEQFQMSPYYQDYAKDITGRVGDIQGQVNPYLQNMGSSIEDVSNYAKSTDLSPYALAQLGDMDKNVQGAYGQAVSGLASTGGLESGARNRLASESMKNKLFGTQEIYGQEAINKQNLLTQLPGMYSSAANTTANIGTSLLNPYAQAQLVGVKGRETDIDKVIAERGNAQNYALQRGNTQAQLYGAGQTAMAQPGYNPYKTAFGG